NPFGNRQRTSPRSGITKAEAVYRFACILKSYRIETLADANSKAMNPRIREKITDIPGQASGLSFDYFLMLAGHTNVIKADRMICRFVASAVGRQSVSQAYARELLFAVLDSLRKQ